MSHTYKLSTAIVAIAAVLAAPAVAQDAQGDTVTAQSGESTDTETSSLENDAPVISYSSDVDPLYGNIDPFYGTIGAFWDDISPFYGTIGAFYGNIEPFWGDIGPFYGNIEAFWGNIGPFTQAELAAIGEFWVQTAELFRQTDATWAALQTSSGDPLVAASLTAQLNVQLADLIATSNAQWGSAVEQASGDSFDSAFVAPILARHGIDLDDPASLAALSASQRSAFFLDWHDSLMAFSGVDHVDHWMGAINWAPAITQIQGSTGRTVIGILDSTITGSGDLADNVISATGNQSFVGGHGAGVASLMVAAHDGRGVMGIAPNARVVSHNPFDANETASWQDVQYGIEMLINQGSSIVNLSLGEAGTVLSSEWRDVFASSSIAAHNGNTVYVLAAGNDGIVQTADIDWTGAQDTDFILVGSISPDGAISSFSNQPGTACLLTGGACGANLMDRFIVAPGELILVDDGLGGTVRRSGTSFSAPLVSGTIALLHDRWPWLAYHSDASVEIVLRSARDLGAPGVDAVYGVGMLDVVASQSPLDFNAMTFTMYQRRGNRFRQSTHSATTLFDWGVPTWWNTDDVFFAMYEEVGDTYRDFAVPMSSYTTGKRTNVLGGGYQRLQDFVSDRFARWIRSRGADSNGDGVAGISQLATGAVRQAGTWNLQYTSAMPRVTDEGAIDPVHTEMTLTDPSGRFGFDVGYGQGALALSGERFGVISDFDRSHGGANPVLGFASGEFFTSASMALARNTSVRIGYTENRQDLSDLGETGPLDRFLHSELGAHEAHAFTAGIEQNVARGVSFNLQYTDLSEEDALLGVQSGIDGLLDAGSRTQAVTLSGTLALGARTHLDMSATSSNTLLDEGQMLSSETGALGTAAQIAVTRRGLFDTQDSLRVTFGQPLNVERGEVQLHSLQVIDRETGERGMVAQSIGIETKRRVMGELVYASPVLERGEFGLFGRFVSEGVDSEGDGVMAGANFGLRF